MTTSSTISRTVSQIIYSALRKVNGYSDSSTPDSTKVEEARLALMEILASWESPLKYFFTTRFRTRTFEDASIVVEDSVYYRCIRGFTSYNASEWAASTAYSKGDYILPTTYNGYIYIAENAGTSHTSEATWPEFQGRTVTDNDISWRAIPDMKPGAGKAWTAYFVADSSETSGSAFTYNTEYSCPGDFALLDDEYDIIDGFVRYQELDTEVEKVEFARMIQMHTKDSEGIPTKFSLELKDAYTTRCYLQEIPQYTGDEGYIFHYRVRTRNTKYSATDDSLILPDAIYRALIWELSAEIGPEWQIPDQTIEKWESKAKKLLDDAVANLGIQDGAGFIDGAF